MIFSNSKRFFRILHLRIDLETCMMFQVKDQKNFDFSIFGRFWPQFPAVTAIFRLSNLDFRNLRVQNRVETYVITIQQEVHKNDRVP